MAPDEKAVGIDLGTTNSLVAAVRAGVPDVLSNAEGERSTPSVVAFTKEGELLVGLQAKRQAALNPESTFHSVKRFIGCQYREVEQEARSFPYSVVDVDGQAQLECPALGKRLKPEEVSAHVLRKLKADAEGSLGAEVRKAVISVPAYFNDAQRQATKAAGQLAGLEVLRIVNEPTMAALAYGLDQTNFSTIAVLDLGGGTFDVSMLETGDGVLEVLATSGDTHFGGNDFDRRILDWLLGSFQQREGIDLRQDGQALQRLTEASERAKVDLSQVGEVRISVPFITADESGPKHIDENLTRAKFEELCEDLVERMRGPLQEAFKIAQLDIRDLHEVVLVGGSCRVPAVQALAGELLSYKPVNSAINPEEVVAIGAAVQAGMIVGEVQDITLIDVTPLTLGVETNGGVFSPVIERNTAIPTKQFRLFTTSADAQDSIEVRVLQGERALAADNKELGTFRLDGLPPAPVGIPKIEVTFEVDRDGILSVSAKDWATKLTQDIRIVGTQELEDREKQNVLEEAADSYLKDEIAKDELDLRFSAECLIRQTWERLAELGDRVPVDSLEALEPKLEALQKASDEQREGGDHTELRERVKDVRFELMKLGPRVWGKQVAPDNQPGPARPRAPGGVAGGGYFVPKEGGEEKEKKK